MVYTEIGSLHRRSCGDGLKSWNGMPRHHETGFLFRRAFPAEKAGKIGQTQPSDHRRTVEETKRAPSLHHQVEEKNTRWKWNERRARTEPNPKQLELESQVDPILPIASSWRHRPITSPPHAGRRSLRARFGTSSKFPRILAAPGTSIFHA
jgi:hypothetical protein